MDQTKTNLQKLNWHAAAANFDLRNQQAMSENITYATFVDLLMEDELAFRSSRDYEARLRASMLDPMMLLENFDWAFNAQVINKKEMYEYASCKFIKDKRSLIFYGKNGCGKSHLATAICHEALKKGYSVFSITMEELVMNLYAAILQGPTQVERQIKKFVKPDVLYIDEMGMENIPQETWGKLYRIINLRYKNQMSLVLTSNRAFGRWGELFLSKTSSVNDTVREDDVIASALIQRMVHRAHLIKIEGKSYRLKDFEVADIDNNNKSVEPNPDQQTKQAKNK